MAATTAHSFEIETGNPDLKARWDTSVKYSTALRVKAASAGLVDSGVASVNQDDGDRNFGKGLISNRADLLSEFDVKFKGFGARIAGTGWYDALYNRGNDNASPFTANAWSVPHDQFTAETARLHGKRGELLDAFVFGSFDLGDSKLSLRAGRHAVVWGESLFFGGNGIAGGQAPVDIVKALSVPGTQFKELIRPVPQLSAQLQLTSDMSLAAYYQVGWEKSRLPAVGSYFSVADTLDKGGERLLFGAPLIPGGGPAALFRDDDIKARNSGQGGVQLRVRLGDADLGFYAIRFHDKTPNFYLRPGVDPSSIDPVTGRVGRYKLVYAEGIRAFGASASRTFGNYNMAAELSVRRNTPLSSDAALDVARIGDGSRNPLYAVGNSVHFQVSWLASMEPSLIAQEADFLGEIAWNRRTGITKNPGALNPLADKEAINIRVMYEPRYRQVVPGIDLSLPVGLGYGIGNSSVGVGFNGNKVGDLSLGVKVVYLNVWNLGVNYTHFIGPEGTYLDAENHISFKQSLKDRNYISLSLQRTF